MRTEAYLEHFLSLLLGHAGRQRRAGMVDRRGRLHRRHVDGRLWTGAGHPMGRRKKKRMLSQVTDGAYRDGIAAVVDAWRAQGGWWVMRRGEGAGKKWPPRAKSRLGTRDAQGESTGGIVVRVGTW